MFIHFFQIVFEFVYVYVISKKVVGQVVGNYRIFCFQFGDPISVLLPLITTNVHPLFQIVFEFVNVQLMFIHFFQSYLNLLMFM